MTKRMWVLWLALGLSMGVVGCDDEDDASEDGDDGSGDGTGDGSSDGSGDGDPGPDAGDVGPDAGPDAGAGDAGEQEPIEIAGRWHANIGGGTEVIDGERWTYEKYASYTTTVEYDNDENYVILQNPEDDMGTPGKFSKVVWLEIVDEAFWYCTAAYGLDTADAAREATGTVDADDLDTTGCNDFPWTQLSPVIEVEGAWGIASVALAIDSDAWGEQTVVSYDNAANSAILQNPDSGDAALKFSKVVWVPGDAGFQLCEVSSAQDSAALAESEASEADPEDLTTGCNGGAWTAVDVAS